MDVLACDQRTGRVRSLLAWIRPAFSAVVEHSEHLIRLSVTKGGERHIDGSAAVIMLQDHGLKFALDWRIKETTGLYPVPTVLPDGTHKKGPDGKDIVKVIVVPRRLVNIVVG